jgi:hypothetical protein
MTKHKKKQQRYSCIDHTTPCPYCGIRCLPINLEKHIQNQHAELAKGWNTLGPNICPYCMQEFPTYKLLDHVLQDHHKQWRLSEKHVIDEEKRELRQTRERRRLISEPELYKKMQLINLKTEVKVKRDLERSKEKAIENNLMITCKYCYQSVTKLGLKEYIKKFHPDKVEQ